MSVISQLLTGVIFVERGGAAAPASNTLSGFRTANELRNRSAKAAEASNRRLRAKGFQLEAQPAPLIQEG
ncbi:MAG TPA: hypothetical protein DDY43_05735 [Synechococcales bacterium UBA10510]|nr:hypothetical protein [Synechococcales bacterium UBA10510]